MSDDINFTPVVFTPEELAAQERFQAAWDTAVAAWDALPDEEKVEYMVACLKTVTTGFAEYQPDPAEERRLDRDFQYQRETGA